jgi:hypothetical protein
MNIAKATTNHADREPDHDRELGRAIRHALVVALGERAAQQALRHDRVRPDATGPHAAGPHRLIRAAGHMAGYGMLLALIWHQRRAPQHSAAGA